MALRRSRPSAQNTFAKTLSGRSCSAGTLLASPLHSLCVAVAADLLFTFTAFAFGVFGALDALCRFALGAVSHVFPLRLPVLAFGIIDTIPVQNSQLLSCLPVILSRMRQSQMEKEAACVPLRHAAGMCSHMLFADGLMGGRYCPYPALSCSNQACSLTGLVRSEIFCKTQLFSKLASPGACGALLVPLLLLLAAIVPHGV